ncbi:hypothetical protein B0H15DRAFT_861516 [Mycena belliarum]|uniref:DUF6534 domain-containing protein n=1 Tax=Mycena belliarum TaxID=1033014 RepID=A0AAD6TU36_9AGAR|nr:hypothetical protein B0H15DRAFT_861516 [Mycena belliae]
MSQNFRGARTAVSSPILPPLMSAADASGSPASVVDLNTVTTAILIGSLLNFFFFGALVVQTCIYSMCFPQDSRITKGLVYSVLLVETASVCLNASDLHHWFVVTFGDLSTFLRVRNAPFYAGIAGGINGTIVQFFFCYRILVIKRSAWPMAVLIALLSLTQCATGMASGLHTYIHPIEHWYIGAIIVFPTWLAGNALVEILIAVTMTYLLIRATASVQPSTRDLIRAIVTLIIETNIFTAVVAILALSLFLGCPNADYFVTPTWNLSGVYANTLLTILNNRAVTRSIPDDSWAEGSEHSITFARIDRPTSVGSLPEMSFAGRQSGGVN